ncbi:DUF3987 domain-containing protein, partial [Providencia huashanensis]|uniref:DUF3987 domain-containing protein n=1 Tax=Providencia huashanensis TaxID=3037798 RepID=UPI004045BA68
GHALNELGFINKMWDGSSFSIARKTEEERYVKDGRMTVSLMVQPPLFTTFTQKNGNKAKDIGFLARVLICYPKSTQGERLIESTTMYSEHLEQFHSRINEILRSSIHNYQQGIEEKILLRFSPEAEQKWIAHYNAIESTLRESGSLYHYKEFGSKIAENIARIAALIHYFSSSEELISLESLDSGFAIGDWFYKEQLKLFPLKNDISESAQDTEELLKWIKKYSKENQVNYIAKNIILQYGPNKFRNATKLNILLEILINQFRIFLKKINKKTYITANPQFDLPPNIIDIDDNTNRPMMEIIGDMNKGAPDLTISDLDNFIRY